MCRAIGYGLAFYAQLARETKGEPFLRRTGSLHVALMPRRVEYFHRQVEAARKLGIEAEFVGLEQIKRLAPAIDVKSVLSAYFVPGDGYLDSRAAALAMADAAARVGLDVRLNVEMTGLVTEQGRVKAIDTSEGRMAVSRLVIAAGPWTARLSGSVAALPVALIRHQRVRTAATDAVTPEHPVVRIPDLSCYMRPERGGLTYGFFEPEPTSVDLAELPSTFRTADVEPPVATMDAARSRLQPVVPLLGELDIVERYQGLLGLAPDAQYVVGAMPGVQGVFVGCGCAALGIAGAPAVGRWLAQCVVEDSSDRDRRDFDPARFDERSRDADGVREMARRRYADYYAIPTE
jgi:4-methylaminobutanoate oxidase (formaldehyde-forming)